MASAKVSTIGLEQKFSQLINLESTATQLEIELKQLKKSTPKNLPSPLKVDEAESLIVHHKNIKKLKASIKENEASTKECKASLEELIKILDGKDVVIPSKGVNYTVSYSNGKLKYRMIFTTTEAPAVTV
jgi:hypothetical protein